MLEVVSAHVTHHWVDIEDLELVAAKEARSLLRTVAELPAVAECALLKTCNRVEVYVATEDPDAAERDLASLTAFLLPDDLTSSVRFLRGEASLRHLFRVAAGLDSLIVGEDQILGQVKEAYAFAEEEGTLGKTLSVAFRKAISVGKRVRAETRLNEGGVSIGSAAVDLARRLLGDLNDRVVLVLGAGEIATLVAKALARFRLKAIFVANRQFERAEALARELHGVAITFEEMPNYLPLSDVVICATNAPHVILGREELGAAFANRSPEGRILIIDIANPRNVEEAAGDLPFVELRNLDGLREIAAEHMTRRRREMAAAEAVVNRELPLLLERMEGGEADDLARRLYTRMASLRDEEVAVALRRFNGGSPEYEAVVRALGAALVNKILAGPTAAIKDAARRGDLTTLRAAARLFDLEEG